MDVNDVIKLLKANKYAIIEQKRTGNDLGTV